MSASRAQGSKATAGLDSDALRSELRRLEAEVARLRCSEKMYRISAAISGQLAWYADSEGRLIAISSGFSPLTGIPEDRLLGGAWIEAIHPEDRELFQEAWAHSLRTGDKLFVQFRSLRADGAVRMALARAVAERSEDGRILCWYGLTQDVHEEQEAEQARYAAESRLRESEQLHRFTLELTRQIVWSVEPDGSGLMLSPRYAEVTGMDPTVEPSLAIHPDDRERIESSWMEAVATGEPYSAECRLVVRGGDYRFYRLRAAPLRDPAGRIVRWYGVSEDIHEERQAEQARRDAEQRYRLAVQATNDAVWDYDVDNDILDWSDNSARIFGSPEAPIGHTRLSWWVTRLHPDDRERISESFRRALHGHRSHWSASYRFQRSDGGYADILDRGFIIRNADGRALRAVGAMADVTERNRAEEEIIRMQSELIHVSRLSAMGAMASTLAHELNQPLTAASNFISGARRLVDAETDQAVELVAALESAGSATQRAGEILRRLRELVSRGAVAVTVEDLPRLIEEASVLGFVDERSLGISHRLELDPAARCVHADRIQIQQVLINLIRNAIDAMEQNPEGEIVLSTRAMGDMVEVAVADDGPGIRPEHFGNLFSRFMTTKSAGMGIGLPISRTIVELHGGKIWAENRPGGGAIFRFTLPTASEAKHKPR
ncbi:PAS domain-containing sensor histidine kinase [Sphingosinicella sp. CPCC 101087]|uniref:PAS domain-containing sensor histidine kinase n=1 Tax=Sphingosinicella sp. CPCC 101087 TaxID=2497754 RepID=UPI0013EDDDD8|nr:PAS domain-containing sensor histidine kinase [Sphingosinicella sp. CPCC 101087]